MARRVLCLAADLVGNLRQDVHVQYTDAAIEDPSEFFTMIFGGEAFVDWYGIPSGSYSHSRGTGCKC
jgi:hypothetical protein